MVLPAVEIETGKTPDATVIWLHGLGSDGNDFAPIVGDLGLPNELNIRFIFPHAPSIPVTLNNGYVMPAWYDVFETGLDRKVDTVQLEMSAQQVMVIVTNEIGRGVSSERIIIAGFSQGGAVAYHTVLSSEEKIGGLLAMSTYFATKDSIVLQKNNRAVPILIQHGTQDGVVSKQLGDEAVEELEKSGYVVDYKTYPMGHTVCPEQIADIGEWIRDILTA